MCSLSPRVDLSLHAASCLFVRWWETGRTTALVRAADWGRLGYVLIGHMGSLGSAGRNWLSATRWAICQKSYFCRWQTRQHRLPFSHDVWEVLHAIKGPIVFWSELDGDGSRSERDWPRCLDYSAQCSCSRAVAASHALCKAGLKPASSPNLCRSSNPALWDNQIRIQSGIKTWSQTCRQVCQLPQNLPTN